MNTEQENMSVQAELEAEEIQVNVEEKKPEGKLGKFACILGFSVSIISLFISFFGVVALIAVIISCMGYVKAADDDKKSRRFAAVGVLIGLLGMIYSFVLMVFM